MSTLLHAGLENAAAAGILALLVALLTAFGPLKRRPAWCHAMWLLVLVKLITPSPWAIPLRPAAPPAVKSDADARVLSAYTDLESWAEAVDGVTGVDTTAEVRSASSIKAAEVVPMPIDLETLAATVWLAGAGVSLVVAATRVVRFRNAINREAFEVESVTELADDTAARFGMARSPEVLALPGGVCPMVWSFGLRPLLLVPFDLWKGLGAGQRATLLAHELAHIKRGDHLVRVPELLISALFWWLPVVWWARRKLHEAEERCCDAWVVWALPGEVKAYAETLLETVDYLADGRAVLPTAASGFGPCSDLKRRLLVIRRGDMKKSFGLGGYATVLGFAALSLPWGPTWAQPPKPPEAPAEPTEVRVVIDEEVGYPDIATVNVSPATVTRAGTFFTGKPMTIDFQGAVAKVNTTTTTETSTKDGEDDGVATVNISSADDELSDAVVQLKARLEELEKKGDKKGAKAIESAIKALGEVSKSSAKSGEPHAFTIVRRVETQDESTTDKPASPEKAADTAKSKAEMAKLQAELKEAHTGMQAAAKKVAEAQRKFSEAQRKLGGAANSLQMTVVRSNRLVTGAPNGIVEYKLAHGLVPPVPPVPPGAPAPARAFGGQAVFAASSNRRIEELEKKLDRVLDQLESLKKKDRDKD